MKSSIFFISVFCFGLMATLPAAAQNYQQMLQDILQQQDSTQTEIEQLDALINQYQQRLSQAEEKFDEVYTQYENLKRLLALQEQKIASLQKERGQINAEIAVTGKKLKEQQEKLKKLIDDYKETMRYVYKHGRTSQMALILSSGSVNQMMVRNYYLKKFESYRENQAAEIEQTQEDLKESQLQLDEAAERNKDVLAEIQTEKEELAEKTKLQQNNVNLLSRDRLQWENRIATTQQEIANFNSTFTSLVEKEEVVRQDIQQEIEEQRQQEQQADNLATSVESPEEANVPAERALAENTEYSGTAGFLNNTELAKIESAFSSQKGTLPWPVESSTISEHFGRKRHPVYGTFTDNLGIEIITKKNAPVKVVHGGQVFAVQPIAGYGDVVFVSHGKYKTAYGNLSRVLVRKNTILKKGEVIGYAGDEYSTRGESVFFILREGSQNVDPESWLK